MDFVRNLDDLKPHHKNCAITIGNFDGLHLGHLELLKLLHHHAKEKGIPKGLMTFEPFPHEYFCDESSESVPRLISIREKVTLLNNLKPELRPDFILLLRFNSKLAKMTANKFISNILIKKLNVVQVVIGDDFRFGKDRAGNYQTLVRDGEKNGFEVIALSTHNVDNVRVSSTRIREALQSGDLQFAQQMAGSPYTICGRVSHGDKRGRTIGFPTANIDLKDRKTPLRGVYSVSIKNAKHDQLSGVANIGIRPTVDGETEQLEVHIFDFDEELYGQYVSVTFHGKLRDEKKFESIAALKAQIQIDCKNAIDQLKMKNLFYT